MQQQGVTDRLILALVAQLRAERETRHALAFVIRHGVIDRDVLLAILDDPIPPVALDDLVLADELGDAQPPIRDRLS